MTDSTTDAVTRKVRKPHRCSWCWEWIAKGEAHRVYTQFGGGGHRNASGFTVSFVKAHAFEIVDAGTE